MKWTEMDQSMQTGDLHYSYLATLVLSNKAGRTNIKQMHLTHLFYIKTKFNLTTIRPLQKFKGNVYFVLHALQ